MLLIIEVIEYKFIRTSFTSLHYLMNLTWPTEMSDKLGTVNQSTCLSSTIRERCKQVEIVTSIALLVLR